MSIILVGCGGSSSHQTIVHSPQKQIQSTLTAYSSALSHRNGAKYCSLILPQERKRLMRAASSFHVKAGSCGQVVTEVLSTSLGKYFTSSALTPLQIKRGKATVNTVTGKALFRVPADDPKSSHSAPIVDLLERVNGHWLVVRAS